jgi:hypothetical protein
MKPTLPLLAPLTLAMLLAAKPAQATPGGDLRVLLKGYWLCETQGDATMAPARQLQDSFRVIPDSSYRTTAGLTGTYLLLGTDLTITGGPFRGRRYKLVGQGILHALDQAGKRTTERCVRQASASALNAE